MQNKNPLFSLFYTRPQNAKKIKLKTLFVKHKKREGKHKISIMLNTRTPKWYNNINIVQSILFLTPSPPVAVPKNEANPLLYRICDGVHGSDRVVNPYLQQCATFPMKADSLYINYFICCCCYLQKGVPSGKFCLFLYLCVCVCVI